MNSHVNCSACGSKAAVSAICILHGLEWGHTPTLAATGNPPPRLPLSQRMNSHRGIPLLPLPLPTGETESN